MAQDEEKLEFLPRGEFGTGTQGPPPGAPAAQPGQQPAARTPAGDLMGFVRQAKHPVAASFHLAFKLAAIFVYLFGSYISSNFVFVFVVCVLLLAFDFWTVKNVSGRLLVGMRYWNLVKEDGTSEWKFECLLREEDTSSVDRRIFWTGLYANPLVWLLFSLMSVFKTNFAGLLICMVALALSGTNIYGYHKCKKDQGKKIRDMLASGAVGMLASDGGQAVGGAVMRSMFGGGSAAAQGSAAV